LACDVVVAGDLGWKLLGNPVVPPTLILIFDSPLTAADEEANRVPSQEVIAQVVFLAGMIGARPSSGLA
jgi:hypothetical protein